MFSQHFVKKEPWFTREMGLTLLFLYLHTHTHGGKCGHHNCKTLINSKVMTVALPTFTII